MESCYNNSSNGRNRYNQGRNSGYPNCGGNNPRMGNVPNPAARRTYDNQGRTMEIECVCKAPTYSSCYKEDKMNTLGDDFPIAMAYVPWQQWGDLYDPDCGIAQGTIFKDLNKIFCGVRC